MSLWFMKTLDACLAPEGFKLEELGWINDGVIAEPAKEPIGIFAVK